ncbi:3-deoxy-D-manno-octulosonic acid transferase [Leptobacterium flavescens]|uniref:3-deoxy-D-manno-octulosonic acid transferase n=1 Tax=Leptobacterium flavescens TaxID=472055 RepID=A0A6P0UHE9_9FLAO|nr:glycosyltransferase N-terminal domain-containing protein [Leptobacterium flavescens]NER12751.1 3-deoxy-D-manno-octulosonic acid transferase [Leptobacterium flavescens]
MSFIYNLLIYIVGFFLKIASFFNKKLRLFVDGRKTVFQSLSEHIDPADKLIWFHTASLGEFEQGLPIIERIKQEYPDLKILLTFFSPSGYEVKKNHKAADIITYLPLDTKKNARKFLDLTRPQLAVFIKYEFWPNYLSELRQREVPTLLVSGIFRKKQSFFKPYGAFMRKALRSFDHFFVQDQNSKELLNSIGFSNITISGDTRFDRVNEILSRDNSLPFIEEFKQDRLCIVAGSSWPEDEALLVDFINRSDSEKIKFVIAPHNIKPAQISQLSSAIEKKTVLFSEMEGKDLSSFDVFIADTIGILTKIYSYADIAYVGGGMGNSGLHNTLEPAVFGIPVVIGKNYSNFKEATDLVKLGGIVSISNGNSFNDQLSQLTENREYREKCGKICGDYVSENTGASIQILSYIRTLFKNKLSNQ